MPHKETEVENMRETTDKIVKEIVGVKTKVELDINDISNTAISPELTSSGCIRIPSKVSFFSVPVIAF